MQNGIKIITNKIKEIYNQYENYVWHNPSSRITILTGDETISLYLQDNENEIDEFILTFNKMETKIYHYISLNLFNDVFGDVFVNEEDGVFSNENIKPYVSFIVSDEYLLNTIRGLVINQANEYLYEGIKKIYSKAPFRIYNKAFINQLEIKNELTKKLLRSNNQ